MREIKSTGTPAQGTVPVSDGKGNFAWTLALGTSAVPSGDTTGATDTAKLQSVFQNGGVLGAGTYWINATIVPFSGASVVVLAGEAIIKAAPNLNAPLCSSNGFSALTLTGNNTGGISNFTWRGRITWDGNASNQSVAATAGVQLYGYNYKIDTMTIRNVKAVDGLYTEWGAGGTPTPDKGMESVFDTLRIHDNVLTGAEWHNRGPHDSTADTVIIHNSGSYVPMGLWCETSATTTVAAGSNGVDVSTFGGAGTLNVATVLNFPSSGSLTVATSGGTATVTYTGTSGGNSLTGCTTTAGTGTLSTGGAVTGPQYSGTALLIDKLHIWGNHTLAFVADARVEARNAQIEAGGSGTGLVLIRSGGVSIEGRVFYLTSGNGYGIQLGDTVNKATGYRLLGVLLENFTGGAAAQAAINFVNTASGRVNALISKTNNNQQIYGTKQPNESFEVEWSGGTTSPAVAAAAGAGSSPPAPTSSNATDNRLTVNWGTGTSTVTGSQVAVTFNQPRPGNPTIVLAPLNAATAALQPYVSGKSNTGFSVACAVAPAISQAAGTFQVEVIVRN